MSSENIKGIDKPRCHGRQSLNIKTFKELSGKDKNDESKQVEVISDETSGWSGFESGLLKKSLKEIETHVDQHTGKSSYVYRIGHHDCEDAEFEIIE